MGLNLAEALLANDPDSNFLPCASMSLYADPSPSLGCCGICLRNLELQSEDHCLGNSAVSILPCGHIACIDCFTNCLQNKAQCPFCRFDLNYELCSHRMKARVITRENLLSMPQTIPMGGKIPYQCCDCRVATNKTVIESLLKSLELDFQTLRERYKTVDGRRKEAIERKLRIMQEQFQMVAGQLSAETSASLTSQW